MGQEKSKPFNGFNLLQTGDNNFKYMYTIENFSLRTEKTGEKIISPIFVIGSKERSEWRLEIYPNGQGEKSKEYVSVFLTLLKPEKAKVKLRFSILNDKEEEKNISIEDNIIDLNKGSGWGFPNFVKKDFLLDRSNGLLINDKFTIICEAEITDLKYENSIPYDVLYISQTDVNNFKYKYTIQNFSLRSEKTGEKIISSTFVIGSKERSEWRLEIYPNGINEEWKEFVSVYLALLKPEKAKAKYRFSILNDKGEEKNVFNSRLADEFVKDKLNGSWGYPEFVKRDFLLNKSNGLLINDKFTIICEAEITDLKYENSILYDVFYTNQTDVSYFKYKYTIQNFSLRPEKTGEQFVSPTFVIGSKDRSEWCLSIYPNGQGEKSKEYVSVFLTLLKPEKAKVKLRFSILNDKEEEKNISIEDNIIDLNKGSGWGFPNFVKKDFLLDRSNGLLINDKLTILCEADVTDLKSENSIPYDVFYINQTDVNNFKYIYTIENFSLRLEKTGEKIISPTFVIGSKEKSEWCLHIYPNGIDEWLKEYVSVYLTLLKPDKAKANYRISILNYEGEETNVWHSTGTREFDRNNENFSWGYRKFVKKDFLLDESNGLLVNGCLVIFCEAEIIDLRTENHSNLEIVDSKTENHDKPETSINISIPQSKLLSDYGNMFDSPLFYDCVIKVEDTEIQVHKEILAKRSPFFCDIFKGTLEESQTNIIEIKDFSAEVVRKMLKYIYTDEVPDIQDMANEIFEIANKYELDRLKAIAEQSMCNSLSIENVCERFALSDKYPTERLKECCEEIILKNMEYLKETEEWKKFILVRPLLLQSLLFKLSNISSTRSNSEKKEIE